jgi:tetratricopeptide (TPR) repeat protein
LPATIQLAVACPQPAFDPSGGTIPLATPVDTVPGDGHALASEPALVPGYEIIGVLGRGGMGVVYKAVQVSLKRVVALKMILAGAHAAPAELARFRTEAEAVAQLQHPNIVQIYEIGEQNGLPYFSLEFVDGGSLATRIGGKPLPSEEAAHITLTLARAMHHCHQKGIVHRDLKPANVLVNDGVVSGDERDDRLTTTHHHSPLPTHQYKITDFGLAKQLEVEGQTRSGAVLGTPSYMAPEQATGRTGDIGPRTDVYALGAVLYEMLTGGPPFRGETSMDTLLQVVSNEPVPPTRLQARLPRDLETICLKALAKEPAGRYHSALALAQDLERFQAGEPILGRREGLVAKLWRKARRSPVAAGSVAAGILALILGTVIALQVSSKRNQERLKAERQTEVAQLSQAFEAGLNATDWTPAHLSKMEGLAADLERRAPDQAGAARGRLNQRFGEAIRASFSLQNKPVLEPADVVRVAASIDLLAARDAELARTIRQELADRSSVLDPVLDLHASWGKLNEVFASPIYQVHEQKKALVSRAPDMAAGLVMTRVAARGDVEMEATFSSWTEARQIGLVLQVGAGGTANYSLVLTVPDQAAAQPGEMPAAPRRSMGDALRQPGGRLSMQIVRNNVRVREQAVWLSGAPVVLRAIRKGDRITLQIKPRDAAKTLLSIEFEDLFPFSGSQGDAFGLYWPGGVVLEGLKAWRQTLPAAPSPLQKGDDYYAQGKFDDALTEYRRAAGSTPDRVRRQEAHCKEGLCLLSLQRGDEATAAFREVARDSGQRWPIVAGCLLWRRYAQNRQFDEADDICRLLSAHSQAHELARLVPHDVASDIRLAYLRRLSSFTYGASIYSLIRADPDRNRDLDRALAAERLLDGDQADAPGMLLMKTYLVRGYHATGQNERAIQMAEELLGNTSLHPWYRLRVINEYTCLSIPAGKPDRALAVVNKYLMLAPNQFNPQYLPLLQDRARLHYALKQWDQAEKDLDEVIRLLPKDESVQLDSHLMKGFLRERAGDAAGAQEAWRQGWTKIKGTRALFDLTGSMLGALADEINEKEIDKLVSTLVAGIDKSSPFAALIKNDLLPAPFVTAVSKERYRSPRGKEYCRRIAFRDINFPEGVAALFSLTIYEAFHQGAVTGTLTAEQDALLWKMTNDMYEGYTRGKYNEIQGFQLAQAWLGTTNLLGWGGLKGALAPSVRGPLAYALGHRYRQLKKPQEAADFFKQAIADAPEKSPLRELAQAELDRMK